MLITLRLLILLVIFSSQYVYAESYMKDAQDGLPKAQYEYAMSLVEKGKKNIALDWFTFAAAQGHLKSSLWIEQNIDQGYFLILSRPKLWLHSTAVVTATA